MTYPVLHDPWATLNMPHPCAATPEAAMRARHRYPVRLQITVYGPYAFAGWRDIAPRDGGGEGLLQRRDGRWCVVTAGGGVLGEDGVRMAGMPPAIAHRLMLRAQHSPWH